MVCWLVAFVIGGHVFLSVGMGSLFPQLRDPEYGRKRIRLEQRLAENPARPLVLVLGSSRIAMGLRPGVLEPSKDQPIVFNAALVGSGPLMELMCLRRLLADGVKPDGVVIEVWPPFLHDAAYFREYTRIDINRVRLGDIALLQSYASAEQSEQLIRDTRWVRISPWYSHRFFLLSQVFPTWVATSSRRDFLFNNMDEWGWLPGVPASMMNPASRAKAVMAGHAYYAPMLADWKLHADSDRALHELLDLCRAEKLPVTLLMMPESSELRGWYSDGTRQRFDAYLRNLRETHQLPLFDLRDWMTDDHLSDTFHLSREGAIVFTERFGREVLPKVRVRGNMP